MNRRKSSVYTLRLDILYFSLLLLLLPVRLWIDRGLDQETLPAVIAQPLFWFLCGVVSLPIGVFGLRIRCGLRLQLRFLLNSAVYFGITLLLEQTGLPTVPLAILASVLAIVSIRFWHRAVSRILSCRAFRVTSAVVTAGDMAEVCVRVAPSYSGKNPFAERRAAR
ncbi:hypothetical protein CfE428DRAFT_0898 [Chthoniobacter flavus Ellin428]|uniref:Uncharacterized protein n=1 Tax=Chthoniobacter flavus Ellin428 TaxID=497964 RepID=B4CW61_9BACT|nr:hypothetical protein [Chthoniobacter flavus]EDY21653.1 hypothetical protein CfE428DRAFT_0898 [Chthoniobacter flavus Ellin428]TCO95591.1 hypothetical protein EV701_101278 [Chthoniobacter flavus]